MLGVKHTYFLMLAVCGAGIVIDALERMTSASKYADDGIYSWIVLRQRLVRLPAPLRGLADRLCAGSARLQAVLVLRIAAVALVLVSPFEGVGYSIGLSALVATQAYVFLRTAGFGAQGPDPMTLVICGSAWLTTVVVHGPRAARAGLWFVALQVCLGYVVAGLAKLISATWRSGRAIAAVLSTHTYGHPKLHELVRGRRLLSIFLCWSVMSWEATFPIVLVVPRPAVWPLLALGVLFHLSIAALMGFNGFLFAFPAAYFAILAVRP